MAMRPRWRYRDLSSSEHEFECYNYTMGYLDMLSIKDTIYPYDQDGFDSGVQATACYLKLIYFK